MEENSLKMDEAPKDPGVLTRHPHYADIDYDGHRAHAMYVGFHVPGIYKRRPHRRHHRHKNGNSKKREETTLATDQQNIRPITPPADRVQFILGEDDLDGTHESHPLFSELEELYHDGEAQEWRETARWIKFEEDVEEGGDKWSKPHVATISLHSLFELRSCILNGTVMLDLEACSLDQICDLVLENMVNSNQLKFDMKEPVKEALLRRHRHQHEKHKDKKSGHGLPLIRSLADIGRNSSKSMFGSHSDSKVNEEMAKSPSSSSLHGHKGEMSLMPSRGSVGHGLSDNNHSQNHSSSDLQHKLNQAFMKKVPPGSEADNILVGEIDFLERAISGFVRLHQACHLGDLTEVPVPTRFLFILLGPRTIPGRYHEVGRAMATLMSDEIFHDVAYKAKSRQDLLAGVDEFLDAVTILPPGVWDPSIRIEPPTIIPSQNSRKKPDPSEKKNKDERDEEEEEMAERERNGLTRTGRLFGGLINDIKRKAPHYFSDFKDALALQSIASIFFLYFACLTPIITFGGLLGAATHQNIATMESLFASAICGISYGLCSGQPLTILGSTGPILVFETIVHDVCFKNDIDYLSLRFWIGLWTALFLFLFVAFDLSYLVCYITRFTEENFATLISVIFIYKAIENVFKIKSKSPLISSFPDGGAMLNFDCNCVENFGGINATTLLQTGYRNETALDSCRHNENAKLSGPGCDTIAPVPDVFLFSLILFALTYIVSVLLKDFKSTTFFPVKIRNIISDFAVVIAIASMTCLDIYVGIDTPKLIVPEEFKPTSHKREGWLIHPFGRNSVWTILLSIIPAMLATILIFMDQQITAVIVNRKENKLKKGGGYHLDLFIVCILIAVCSIFGLPWFVAATVLSMTHVNSLRMESETAAPGEKPQFLGVREQRVTHVIIFALCGLSVFFTGILKNIPMPILFGVFLYMGTSSLKGSQFFDRILILFMPEKYQPDVTYLRHVPTLRVHLFTAIQLLCFIGLWIIKSYKPTSITFPIMLVVIIGIRKLLDYIFTRRELKILDDVLPEHVRRKREEEKGEGEDGSGQSDMINNSSHGNFTIPLANGNVLKIPMGTIDPGNMKQCSINISEQLTKSGAWKNVVHGGKVNEVKLEKIKDNEKKSTKSKKRGNKKDACSEEEQKRLSTMAEEDEDDCGITIKIDAPTPQPTPAHNSPQ